MLQVLWLTALLFFLPSVLLGTITPMIVKLSLSSLDVTGRVVGPIQAAATLGSILGVFATGFVLISAFGTRPVVAGVTVALLALAVSSNPFWERDAARRGPGARSTSALASRSWSSPRSCSPPPTTAPARERATTTASSVFQEGRYQAARARRC